MTIAQFKKIDDLLKKVDADIEREALDRGLDLMSTDYDQILLKARAAVLEKMGFTQAEYSEIKNKISGVSKEGVLSLVEDMRGQVQVLKNVHVPNTEEIATIAREVAKEFIKPPQIINQIVKEITVKEPQIIRETKIERIIEDRPYNDQPIKDKMEAILKRIDTLPQLPEPLDVEKFKEEMRAEFDTTLKKSINFYNMPDFRKLAMGLQAQVDDVRRSLASASAVAYQQPTSGALNQSTFTWATAPNVIVIDSVAYAKTQTDGTVMWTGTTTTVLAIYPSSNIFAIA